MSKEHFLEFESEIAAVYQQIEELCAKDENQITPNEQVKIHELQKKLAKVTAQTYSNLSAWQITQVSRHPNRPYTRDYINTIFSDFIELHGDRHFADDRSIIGGLARLSKYPVMVIGHQKGRDTKERARRNFGMTRPEGYRKALRLMKLAEKFNIPVITFIDTPGAYPGIDAEEHNQSEAIGRNIYELTQLKVPVIATIIGEGGSGGALALAVADIVMMLQYSIYSVISPEGCASILWKDAAQAPKAAEALCITSDKLYNLHLVDKVISEPIGGAHRDYQLMMNTLKGVLIDQLRALKAVPFDELLKHRTERLFGYGQFTHAVENLAAPVQNVTDEPVTQAEPKLENPTTQASEAPKAAEAQDAPATKQQPQEKAEPEIKAKKPRVSRKKEAKSDTVTDKPKTTRRKKTVESE